MRRPLLCLTLFRLPRCCGLLLQIEYSAAVQHASPLARPAGDLQQAVPSILFRQALHVLNLCPCAALSPRIRGRLPPSLGVRVLPMAADILLHGSDYVLVGADQEQHLEFTRAVARRLKAALPRCQQGSRPPSFLAQEPVCLVASPLAGRIKCLRSPALKMSKSDLSAAGRLELLDPPYVVAEKVAKALTDDHPDPEISAVPADATQAPAKVCLCSSSRQGRTLPALLRELEGQGHSWEAVKKELTVVINRTLAPIQRRFYELMKAPQTLRSILEDEAALFKAEADSILMRFRRALGLYTPLM
ncbi:tryptophanyl-tRNA synthetase [Cyclospora cayetanensis]|uniref:tryptophan--tRNA ligase n=1 Tax=Cyclospora cayetanensis TaxID=88456 RepID=A0A1D3CTM3_9EIME|nr:tryptophanyl-tRNA synthetase [Cyclospora cayetanensis]